MLTTDNPSNIPFHYISAQTVDSNYILALEIDKTLQGLHSAKGLLLTTPFTDEQGEFIRPTECDQLMDISNEIKESAEEISWKVKSIDKLQALSNGNFYKLLMYLYSAIDKSRKLNKQLMHFRSICTDTTSQKRNIFIKIQEEISIIAQTCDQIVVETEELIDSLLLKHLPANTGKLIS
ncbi:MAG: hypothetical protein HZB19_12625 [Chloroflexi bacterium]|nr:hypothetical protein [Chloroflexota bacterium]